MKQDGKCGKLQRNLGWADDRGSVSVLLIFIVAVVFLFTSVLIDYARIAAAEWRTEVLAQSGIRSVMSSYEPALQERYQLFAYGYTDPALIMEHVMQDQNEYKSTGVFPWVPMRLDSHTTAITRPLGGYDEFERQILEDMKYKAPVQFALELSGKLKPLSGALKEAARTTELLAKLQKLADRRNKELDEVVRLQKKARDAAASSAIKRMIASSEASIRQDVSLGSIRSAADIGAQYDDYVTKVHADASLDEGQEKQYERETENYEEDARNVAYTLQRTVSRQHSVHTKMLVQAGTHLNKASTYNEDMKKVIEEVRSSRSFDGYDRAAGQSTGANLSHMPNNAQIVEAIQQINAAADQLVLPEKFVQEWNEEIQGQKMKAAQLNAAANSFQAMMSQIKNQSVSSYALKQSVYHLWRLWGTYEQYYIESSSNRIYLREQEMKRYRAAEKERKLKEKEANQKLGKANDILFALANLDSRLQAHQQTFQEVRSKAEAIAQFNQTSASEERSGNGSGDDAIDRSKQSMDSITFLYDQLAEGMGMLRDRLYRNEYAFLYFTSYDPAKLQSLIKFGQPGEDVLESLGIGNQEVEYILYGFNSPIGNITAAYGEIFAMRLAIRTMEGLVEFSKLANPLLILAAAVVYGIEQALQDMLLLVTRNEIQLSRFLPSVTLAYSDHLRLFMLAHGSRDGMLMRMLALIHHNTGVDPSTRGTYGQVELSLNMPLWFLPGLMKWLGHTGIWDGDISDGRYYSKKTSVFSY
ncbi:acyl-CoA cholesterol acyltransferase [Paenibacillus apiarius]|uniref:Acyl-CoA cholesterol acyltransferase n=1 Tax=Paenibacillus apiarius TaxID=46240 RepID=A0ABT4DW86_9BACL|nr:acyl-CoA cholesterol acyltransferase [Paenibacillus apiarius]MCY9514437.1 acyl-CoA cholesterol acyltransferase [Paenibacillus apiarius]MCY9521025.1 acyl-CoA cholesterol acyltransferase [Paenibacillus apiarius]MCY9551871.1 acyl-CoA cholesterol acyltransferase [Paenibacillus apiarius]MCY9557759.1 acyl-CoA cholesterol acyltransferase [Paenibacillus apiarius]MCY9684446.1 acyl-CoA cholesterol acyltransferase [Paenibacillus apiarius]